MFDSLFGIATDVVKIASAPVSIAADVTRVVTKPVADLAEAAAKEVHEASKDLTE
jgi:hypothetical protein